MRKLANEELGRPDMDNFRQMEKRPIILVLDNIRSLHNIGSIFRTSDAFRIESVYLCGITATPPHREIHKTALGAEETVDWKYFKNAGDAISELKSRDYKILALEQTEDSIDLKDYYQGNDPTAYILGNEVDGVSQELIDFSDGCIEIPQEGTKHSFNVSVSAGILLWQAVYGRLC